MDRHTHDHNITIQAHMLCAKSSNKWESDDLKNDPHHQKMREVQHTMKGRSQQSVRIVTTEINLKKLMQG